MSNSIGLAHIIRQDDGSLTAAWGVHALKSAFQPIFTFRNGKLLATAFEGLIRPFRDGELVAPAAFFSTVGAADRLHVETLTRTLHLLNAAVFLPKDVQIFINFDPSIFSDRAIVEHALHDMRAVLGEAGIKASRVVCEVTEKKSASQEALHDFVEALRANGFSIAVDDYGSDESDINRVKQLKPDIVKFDAQWINRLMESGAGFALLTSMVEAFETRGIRTVFEGIEEGWQIQLAERSGASMVQGFAVARPEIVPAVFDYASSGAGKAPGAGNEAVGLPADIETQSAKAGRPARIFGRRTRNV